MELFRLHHKTPPLAWRMQPVDLNEFLGQRHVLAEGKPLRRVIEEDRIVSLIFYGPQYSKDLLYPFHRGI